MKPSTARRGPARGPPALPPPPQDHGAPVRLLTDRLRRDARVVPQGDVDPAPLEGGHRLRLGRLSRLPDPLRRAPGGRGRRLELEHLARLDAPLGSALGDLAQLLLAATAIVLDVDEDTRPGAPPLGGGGGYEGRRRGAAR